MSGKSKTPTISFSAIASSRIFMSNLAVREELFGQRHTFQFNNHSVSVSIPKIRLDQDLGHPGEKPARRQSWREVEGKITDAWYEIDFVVVVVDLDKDIRAPANIFEVQHNAYVLLGEKESKRNESLAAEYHIKIYEAANYWAHTVRWITRSMWLDAPGHRLTRNDHNLDNTYILRKLDRKPYWGKGGIFVVPNTTRLNVEAWGKVEEALEAGEASPIWFNYLFDSLHRIRIKDIEACVISCAIACETLIRAVFWTYISDLTNQSVIKLIDNINVRSITNQWKHILPGEALPKEIDEILDLRNKILHMGKAPYISEEKLEKLLEKAEKFIRHTDEMYRAIKKLPNRYVDVRR